MPNMVSKGRGEAPTLIVFHSITNRLDSRPMMRRLVALALATSLVQLNILRADLACDDHEQSAVGAVGAVAAEGTTEHAAHHDGAMGVPERHDVARGDAGVSEEACETPVQADCCHALASCSPTLGNRMEVARRAFTPLHAVAVAPPIGTPHSRVTTPDPPPPKA
jgi:hypothetical protein